MVTLIAFKVDSNTTFMQATRNYCFWFILLVFIPDFFLKDLLYQKSLELIPILQKNTNQESFYWFFWPFSVLGAGPIYFLIIALAVFAGQIDTQLYYVLFSAVLSWFIGFGKSFY